MNKPPHIDSDLLARFASGDEPSFRLLYNMLSPAVFRTANKFLHSQELAEDVVQETFLTLWLNREKACKIESIENYVYIMARNLCLRILKNKAILLVNDELLADLSDEGGEDNDIKYTLIDQAIQLLPPQQKKIFQMAKLKGLSHEQISKELHLSSSTINNHITTALRSVRRYVATNYSEILFIAWSLLP